MRNTKDLKEWLTIAKSDLDSASYLTQMKPFPTAIICYHSQQCVEKLLKGFLALNGRPVPKTHNLLMLHKFCCRLDEEFSLILEQCVQLNGYATDIRYPYFEALTVQDGLIAIQHAQKVMRFYKEALNKLNINEIVID
ncbi:HEPN domain-containing protein [Bacillus thuringiensis]|uniref:HEPN domain-containing protein n=2 Tax=Bacillus thuringiensis TaxID=1428 RepID=UPI0007C1868B|nr:HEPN domain-containing protein [Bacillus thuringiensis]AND11073.1 DNA-binding protein [Bacillus thuringiensis serovar alesti]MEC3599409.1 HEPN domain-containing protein [Bacillus thuringiensis]MED1837873.1 HEPN domain-containing protein [Bacillus thuringiensis]MED2207553.1 HEPN domain-containing protein [Bacillus thuringiensis]MED2671782.1 HEPN domain-containing protein [Bacillus thuringiensis]